MFVRRLVPVLWCILGASSALAQGSTGKLVFDVKAFTSEIDLKPKMEQQLKSGGLDWGIVGRQLVVTLVNKRFIGVDIPNLTRFGDRKELDLPPGDYTLTCVGLIPEGGLSVEKVLDKGAYVNQDVLHFTIVAGKTTVLEADPVIKKHNTFFLKFFIPEIQVKVVADGAPAGDAVINTRGDASVPWPQYDGPLKFRAK
ncbi:MAG TPA: hypothetical protein VHH11_04175 [Gammaproteobacteria bacterium]|nr:hypothetical protein [Gammaproteobacteria bacterium]